MSAKTMQEILIETEIKHGEGLDSAEAKKLWEMYQRALNESRQSDTVREVIGEMRETKNAAFVPGYITITLNGWISRLFASIEPEQPCPDTCCDATPCPSCIAAGTAICADCGEESTDMVCGDCVAKLTRKRGKGKDGAG